MARKRLPGAAASMRTSSPGNLGPMSPLIPGRPDCRPAESRKS